MQGLQAQEDLDSSTESKRGDDEGGESRGGTSELAGSEGSYDDEGWRTQSSGATVALSLAALAVAIAMATRAGLLPFWVDDESKEEEIVKGVPAGLIPGR